MTKILMIDDEAMTRNVVSALLRQAAHEVVDAEHGLNGIALALGYPELVKPEPAKPETVNLDTDKPEVVKSDEKQFTQSTTETETGLGDCAASPLADFVVDDAEEEHEPEELSPTRFRTKEFRIQPGDVDNRYLA